MNACIHLCLGRKFLSYLVNILTQDVIKNEWLLFSPLAAVLILDYTCAQAVSYFYIWLTSNSICVIIKESFLFTPLAAV